MRARFYSANAWTGQTEWAIQNIDIWRIEVISALQTECGTLPVTGAESMKKVAFSYGYRQQISSPGWITILFIDEH